MKKPTIKRIQLDKPNEQVAVVKERLAALEAQEIKRNPEFKVIDTPAARK